MGAKAVIIDHEPLMAAQLKKLLQRGDPSIKVKSICYEGEQAMACLAAHQPDIVLSDAGNAAGQRHDHCQTD